jgi:hypothetical protein
MSGRNGMSGTDFRAHRTPVEKKTVFDAVMDG